MAQVVERGYAVSEVADRLGISTKALYTWKAQFAKSPRRRAEVSEQVAEIKRLKRELAQVTEERNVLKWATAYFARESLLSRFAGKPLPGSGYARQGLPNGDAMHHLSLIGDGYHLHQDARGVVVSCGRD